MFFYEVEGHMPKLSSFGRGKKFGLKSHLRASCTQPFNNALEDLSFSPSLPELMEYKWSIKATGGWVLPGERVAKEIDAGSASN